MPKLFFLLHGLVTSLRILVNYIFRFIYTEMYRRVKIKFLIVTTIEENSEMKKGEIKRELLVLLMRFFC